MMIGSQVMSDLGDKLFSRMVILRRWFHQHPELAFEEPETAHRIIAWDIRPHADFGTIEIRAMDAASNLQALHALVAFSRVMAVCMARTPEDEVYRLLPHGLPMWVEKENCYRASHHGLNAEFIYNNRGEHRPLRGLIEDLIGLCEPVAREIGESRRLEHVRQNLVDEPGYARQLRAFAQCHSTRAVVENLRYQVTEDE